MGNDAQQQGETKMIFDNARLIGTADAIADALGNDQYALYHYAHYCNDIVPDPYEWFGAIYFNDNTALILHNSARGRWQAYAVSSEEARERLEFLRVVFDIKPN
jgi:hypothetical protein